MAQAPEDSEYTWTSDRPEYALKRPRFIIKHRGRYYLTRALWEYDAEQAADEEQRQGVAQIKQVFDDQLLNAGAEAQAIDVPDAMSITIGHTTPTPPPPGPGSG